MEEYRSYDFKIRTEADLLRLIREARESGYPAYVDVNGMYYDFSEEYGGRVGAE